MYAIAVRRDFIAQHYLIGGDWGAENNLHSHPYRIELRLKGNSLDQNGYLVDINDIEQALDALISHYQDRTLNELAEFDGLNPSLENFSRILCQALAAHIQSKNITTIIVQLWENESAWASYYIKR